MKIPTTQLHDLARRHGTPLFVYAKDDLRERAEQLAGLELPYGFTPRRQGKHAPGNHQDICRVRAGL